MKYEKTHLKIISSSIIFTKITWIIFALIFYYLTMSNYNENHESLFVVGIEEIDHFSHTLFQLGIGILLIYLFNHKTEKKVCIEGEEKTNLYLFGIFMIIVTLYKYITRIYHKFYKHNYKEEQ